MGKQITSPVAAFPGSITLHDPLPWPVYRAWTAAVAEAERVKPEGADINNATVATSDDLTEAMLPGICACVEKWELNGGGQYTPETFPASPRVAVAQLVFWLTGQINRVVTGETEVPNS